MSKKTLCDWSAKDIDKNYDELKNLVRKPKFICEKCARVSNKKKYLCDFKRL